MRKELEDQLRQEFPVFLGPNEWGRDFLRGFGIECQDGWYDIIREFALEAKKHNETNPDKPVVALIIKEKLGGLRIQGLSNMTDELRAVQRRVEKKSYHVCDQCGKEGVLMRSVGGYLLATRCPDHATDYNDGPMEPYGE